MLVYLLRASETLARSDDPSTSPALHVDERNAAEPADPAAMAAGRTECLAMRKDADTIFVACSYEDQESGVSTCVWLGRAESGLQITVP